jgi:hypothetical protein
MPTTFIIIVPDRIGLILRRGRASQIPYFVKSAGRQIGCAHRHE